MSCMCVRSFLYIYHAHALILMSIQHVFNLSHSFQHQHKMRLSCLILLGISHHLLTINIHPSTPPTHAAISLPLPLSLESIVSAEPANAC